MRILWNRMGHLYLTTGLQRPLQSNGWLTWPASSCFYFLKLGILHKWGTRLCFVKRITASNTCIPDLGVHFGENLEMKYNFSLSPTPTAPKLKTNKIINKYTEQNKQTQQQTTNNKQRQNKRLWEMHKWVGTFFLPT